MKKSFKILSKLLEKNIFENWNFKQNSSKLYSKFEMGCKGLLFFKRYNA